MSHTLQAPRRSLRGVGLAAVTSALVSFSSPVLAQDAELTNACSGAARQYFGNFDATTDMHADDPRVDGTRTAGGKIDLGNYVAEIRCGFPARELRLTEFFVDGLDRLAALKSGGIAPSSGNLPNYARPRGGVLPEGSGFTASSIIPCARPGTGTTQCDVGVVREGNGNGVVMVFWPDAGSRVLYFENGEIIRYDRSEADDGAELRVTRDGDLQIVTVGDARFEVFDALLIGG